MTDNGLIPVSVILDEAGYVECYSIDSGHFENEVITYIADDKETIDRFERYYEAYTVHHDRLQVGDDKLKGLLSDREKKSIREARENQCFPIINRGELWYETLTAEQRQELAVWYQAWLDAPQTLKMPNTPSWLA